VDSLAKKQASRKPRLKFLSLKNQKVFLFLPSLHLFNENEIIKKEFLKIHFGF